MMRALQFVSYQLPVVTTTAVLLLGGCMRPAALPPSPRMQADLSRQVEQQRLQQRDEQYHQAVQLLTDGDLTSAAKSFGTFIAEFPRVASAYLNLSYILHRQQRTEQALHMVNQAIELNPQIPQAFNQRAQLLMEKEDIQGALADYRQAVALDPNYQNAQYNLALLYDIYLQDIANAIWHYDRYLELRSEDDERTREWVNHLKNTLNNG